MNEPPHDTAGPRMVFSDRDILEAMREIPGYLDITPGDFKELFGIAYRRAVERITRTVLAGEIMTRHVVTASPEMPAHEVARLMAERGVSGLPVLEASGVVVGVISEKDFLANLGEERGLMGLIADCLEGRSCTAAPVRRKSAGEIMSAPAITVGEETAVGAIADLFTEKGINRVPVVDERGILKGIVSRADVVRVVTGGRS